ncbi:MAG: methyltransferase domain-containing protein [Coriobacteriia bacterium]|nr:methyltransferase domain-containing protein [Coriobacteriia bacterium]
MGDNETASYWDSQADALHAQRSESLGSDELIIWENALSQALPTGKSLRILDAGTGTGFLSVILSLMGHEVVGVDISPVMIQCAYETAAMFGQRIEFRIMDCANLDFQNESFDAVVCLELMSSLPDERPVLSEFKRVLKTDGHLIAIDRGDLPIGKYIASGFTHCRIVRLDGLKASNGSEGLSALTARKPTRNEARDLPQILLFNRHLQTAKRQIQLYQNWCKRNDIAYQDYSVLNFISHHSNGARPSDISSALVIPPQTLTGILSSLETNGLILREVSAKDRRSSVISLSDAGAKRIVSLQDELRLIEEKAFASFNTDVLADLSATSDLVYKALSDAFGEG